MGGTILGAVISVAIYFLGLFLYEKYQSGKKTTINENMQAKEKVLREKRIRLEKLKQESELAKEQIKLEEEIRAAELEVDELKEELSGIKDKAKNPKEEKAVS